MDGSAQSRGVRRVGVREAGKALVALVTETFERFTANDVPRTAAAMAYFLLLAVAPLLLVLNAVVDVLGVKGGAFAPLVDTLTGRAADTFGQATSWAGSYAPWVAAVLVVVGALSVFAQFVAALDRVWGVGAERPPIRAFLRNRGLALALLAVTAGAFFGAFFVAMVLTIVAAVLIAFAQSQGLALGGMQGSWAMRGGIVLLASAALFEVAFTLAPDRAIKWRDNVGGALVTAVLFTLGEIVLAVYLGATQRFNVFGALQVFVGLIVWIYYSALVVLWGAELSRLLVLRAEARRERAATA